LRERQHAAVAKRKRKTTLPISSRRRPDAELLPLPLSCRASP
jgi:hypothetical protein